MAHRQPGDPRTLGETLKEARSCLELSLRSVESKTSISNAYLSQLETGKITNPSPHVLKKLSELYQLPYQELMTAAGYPPGPPAERDVFLSHRATDKQFVRELAGFIESQRFQDRNLSVWLDEAEILPGDSVPKTVNNGLERSRFIALVMTPAYFESESGWSDAEWHAALHPDPDNRKGRILPLLVYDCPFVPYLLRHLRAIDLRGQRYEKGLIELIAVLTGEPLPRPVTHRGQLITSGLRIDRSTLVAERAIPDADPDVITERLYCNLLPIERLPQLVYRASVAKELMRTKADGSPILPSKSRLKDAIRADQEACGVEPEHRFMPAFRVHQSRIWTFHDLEDPENALAAAIDPESIEVLDSRSFPADEPGRKLVLSLLNMALARHMFRVGLVEDRERNYRYYFPPLDGGPNQISWIPFRKRSVRTVAKPVVRDSRVMYWRHMGADLRMTFIANRFYLQIEPTWVVTHDGSTPIGGTAATKRIARWTGPERNLQVLYHVRFWTNVLRANRKGPIKIWAGDQTIEIATVPALIQQSYGIASDQKPLLQRLDDEAPLIAEEEDELVDVALETDMSEDLLEELGRGEGEDEGHDHAVE
jgi:transcriptional regulator with XRE-family HTH domain